MRDGVNNKNASGRERIVSLILGRLIAPGSENKKWGQAAIPMADSIVEVAADWQEIGSRAHLWEIQGTLSGIGRDRMSELAGRMAAAGEQLGLAFSAAVESDMWRQSIEEGGVGDGAHMGWRAMSELQMLYVLGTGHALINVVARCLALNSTLRSELEREDRFGTSFPPFSDNKQDSLSLNKDEARKLRKVARVVGDQKIDALVEPVSSLSVDDRWKTVVATRGKDFHRWRPQSAGISGMPQESLWAPQGNKSWRLSVRATRPSGSSDHLAHERQQETNEGMIALALAMASFRAAFIAAREPIAGPKFRPN